MCRVVVEHFRFNSKDGAIDRRQRYACASFEEFQSKMVRLIAALDGHCQPGITCFNSKDGAIDSFVKIVNCQAVVCFNSKDGAIDSDQRLSHRHDFMRFNSKDGAIDSHKPTKDIPRRVIRFNSKDGAIDSRQGERHPEAV